MSVHNSALVDKLLKEHQAASVMLQRMRPATQREFAGITLNYELYSASTLSGDFVDIVELANQRVVFLVADVAGHGTSAALVTVVLKSFMSRVTIELATSPAALLSALNAELLGVDLDRHVSALVGVVGLETCELTLASAGAFPLPLYWQADQNADKNADEQRANKAYTLKLVGKALGLFPAPAYVDHSINIAVGDRLTVVTDGVLELLSGAGLEAQEAQLASAAAVPSDEFWQCLGVAPCAGGVDDTTRFTLERRA